MNGYIEIKINNQTVGLKFAYPCIVWFTEAVAKDKLSDNNIFFIETRNEAGEEESEITDYGFAKLAHSAYKNNCLLKEVQPVFVFEDFVNWVEESATDEGRKIMSEVMTCYSESTFSKRMVENAQKKREAAETITV